MYLVREWGAPLLRRLRHALPLCPPFFLLRGYPRERIWYGSGACVFRVVFPIRCRATTMPYLVELRTSGASG